MITSQIEIIKDMEKKDMNKENAIKRINKYGKIGKILTRIALVLLAILAIGTLIAGFALRSLPDGFIDFKLNNVAEVTIDPTKIEAAPPSEADYNTILEVVNNPSFSSGLNLGAIHFNLDHAEIVDGKIIATSNGNLDSVSFVGLSNALFIVVVAIVLTFISLFFGSKICAAFEKCDSPFDENVIKNMKRFAISLIPWALFSSVPENFLNNTLSNSLQLNMGLDLNVIFAVLVILALTVVFKYGAILQQESDETL